MRTNAHFVFNFHRKDGLTPKTFPIYGTYVIVIVFLLQGTNGRVGSPSLSLSVAAHYIDPPLSQSPDLSRLLSAMPDWVTPIAWTCALTKWTF